MYRALESERPDALFSDPFARSLAGERGARIMAQMPKAKAYAWPMVVRTAVMDEVIVRLAPSLDSVINLAAGLDTRPYRLPLPQALRWVEVDFPDTLERKTAALAESKPVCALDRVALDLADRAARRELFARVGGQAGNVLAISEGLLVYLEPAEVGALAIDLAEQRTFRHWLTDVASPFVLNIVRRAWGRNVGSGGAFKFGPDDAPAFFGKYGWHIAEYHSNLIEAERLHRLPVAWFYRIVFAKMWREESVRRGGPMAGVIVLENENART